MSKISLSSISKNKSITNKSKKILRSWTYDSDLDDIDWDKNNINYKVISAIAGLLNIHKYIYQDFINSINNKQDRNIHNYIDYLYGYIDECKPHKSFDICIKKEILQIKKLYQFLNTSKCLISRNITNDIKLYRGFRDYNESFYFQNNDNNTITTINFMSMTNNKNIAERFTKTESYLWCITIPLDKIQIFNCLYFGNQDSIYNINDENGENEILLNIGAILIKNDVDKVEQTKIGGREYTLLNYTFIGWDNDFINNKLLDIDILKMPMTRSRKND